MGALINKYSTTTEPPPKNGQQPNATGMGLNACSLTFLLVPNLHPIFCCCLEFGTYRFYNKFQKSHGLSHLFFFTLFQV